MLTPVLLLAAAAAPADPAPLAVKTSTGITYATADGQKLLLDVAVPQAGGPYPCVVLFHGGAWRAGSRRDLSTPDKEDDGTVSPPIIERLAARGYVVATVGYRLAPKAKFPAPVEDARTAVRFLRANAKAYNIDPDKFAAGGFSAGAHIALLVGLADKSAELDGALYPEQDSRVQCVLDFFGPTDLTLYAATPGLEEAYLVPFLGKTAKADPDLYKRASPINHVTKAAPPVLLVHGNFDLVVPIIHSERLHDKLTAAGATAELITVRGKGHGWFGPALDQSLRDTVKFLDTHLKGKK